MCKYLEKRKMRKKVIIPCCLCLPFQRIFSFSEIIIGGLNIDSDLASIYCFKFEFRSFQTLVFNRCSVTEHIRDSFYNGLIHTFFNWAFLVAQLVKNLPSMWETWVQSLGWEDPLEKGNATHSCILA